jgi:hypothetical protein
MSVEIIKYVEIEARNRKRKRRMREIREVMMIRGMIGGILWVSVEMGGRAIVWARRLLMLV